MGKRVFMSTSPARTDKGKAKSRSIAVLITLLVLLTGIILPLTLSAAEDQNKTPPSLNVDDSQGWSTGVASTYGIGDGFLGKTCANGEILNETDPTFAHKKIPFGTWVEFEYKGKRAVARCNDRGPYIEGREFDLGPALTKALDFSGVQEARWRQVSTKPALFPILFPVAGENTYTDSFHINRSGSPSREYQHRNSPDNRAHEGIDIFAPKGTPVVASVSGTIECRHGSSAGIYLRLIADDGTRYLYIHLDGYAEGIEDGIRVAAGEIIGYVGNTGNAVSTPPHLHFEIRPTYKHLCDQCSPPRYTTPINPYPSLKAAEAGVSGWDQFQNIAYDPGLTPKDGSTVFGEVTIRANPPLGVTNIDKIQFFIDGNLVAEDQKQVLKQDSSLAINGSSKIHAKSGKDDIVEFDETTDYRIVSPSTYKWQTEEYSDGPHTIEVKVILVSGKESWNMKNKVTVKAHDRTYGNNIYETAARISEKSWPDGTSAIVLVRGDNGYYADAMIAAPLCRKYSAPLLFTNSLSLPAETKKEIDRLFESQNMRRVFIIGQSISIAVEETLKQSGYIVNRIAGQNRYDTSLAIAQEVGALYRTALIISEYSYEDAISVSSASFIKQMPILPASGDNGISANALPPQTQEALKSLGIANTIIIGDEKAVSAEVETWLAKNGYNPRRIGGEDKYETSALIAKDPSFGLSPKEPYIVSTEERAYFTDGFAGGLLAARKAVAPVLLVSANELLSPQVKSYLFSQEASKIHIIGGSNVVSWYEDIPAD